ncbi:DUF4380 domain-containing protein [Xanthomonas maliensis]|uniref:DUF4380 domain-containing protein n=1 Tax=Xanthomonas maliensis TaxID=1321368 RepID=UPI0003B7704A
MTGMPLPSRSLLPAALVATLALAGPSAGVEVVAEQQQATPVERISLRNRQIELTVTPAFGGRVLAFQRPGQPNVLKIGPAVEQQPAPVVSAAAGDIAYLGHDVWVGPQSQWWRDQQVNPQRAAEGAVWPPDPYLSLASTRITQREPTLLELDGLFSPVTGVQLHKRFALSAERADTVELLVSAENRRASAVSWDLWFNTRVAAGTRIFVPVADAADVRVQPPSDPNTVAPTYRHAKGVLALRVEPRTDGQIQRGKLLLQPSAGWMAGFAGAQVLVIRFPHYPTAFIHREQGQVELYVDAPAEQPQQGLLELEVHAPFQTLATGQQMEAQERWTLLSYDGPDEPLAQRRFLCSQADALGLADACEPSVPATAHRHAR